VFDNKRILIVDDEMGMRETIQDVLRDIGYKVDTAEHGIKALSLMKKNKYDIAILDIVMPKMDGVSLFKQIKEDFSDTKVIMMTGFGGDHPIVMKANEIEDTILLIKPYHVNELIDTVKAL
jgi:DNA-binding response OmpR family regulator